MDKFYKENNLNKEKEENYNDKLESICKYLYLCNTKYKKLKLYKYSYASETLDLMIEKIIKSHLIKEAEYNKHLERFLSFLNVFFRMEEKFNIIGNNNLDELIQTSLSNVDKIFEEFNGKEIIENYQVIILDLINKQKTSFKELMKKNNKNLDKIIEDAEIRVNKEMNNFKNILNKALNKLEKNIGDELNRIGTEMVSINKDISISFSTKEKLLVSISFATFGVGAIVYGLFYALPNMIMNVVSEERRFQQFCEEIEEKIVSEFQTTKDSIDNNIMSYKKIVIKNIRRFYGVIQAGNVKNDEYWKDAKEIYQILYNNFQILKKNKK